MFVVKSSVLEVLVVANDDEHVVATGTRARLRIEVTKSNLQVHDFVCNGNKQPYVRIISQGKPKIKVDNEDPISGPIQQSICTPYYSQHNFDTPMQHNVDTLTLVDILARPAVNPGSWSNFKL